MTRPYSGRRGAPRPPSDIETEIGDAAKAGDDTRLKAAIERYDQWLLEQGWHDYEAPSGESWLIHHERKEDER
jgi:hypothetical protein